MRLITLCFAIGAASATAYAGVPGRGTVVKAAPDRGQATGSLQQAIEKTRTLRAKGRPGPFTVLLGSGTYRIDKPLTLTGLDSGLRIAAAPGATPKVSGGRGITGWTRVSPGLWRATAPAVRAGQWMFEQLWVNGARATRARTPNTFWSYMAGKYLYGTDPETGKAASLGSRAFRANRNDFAVLARLRPDELKQCVVVAYHSWETSRHYVAGLSPSRSAVILAPPGAPWPFLEWAPNQRYHVENLRSALDAPGEWFMDRLTGEVFYRPLPGQDMRTASVVAPVADQFILLQGSRERPIKDIAIEGISFEHGQYLMPAQGHADGQAEVGIPALVEADYCSKVSLRRCRLAHIGGWGVWFRKGCQDCRIVESEIADTGAGAVRIGETVIQPAEADRTGTITIDNNLIHSGGRLHHGAMGVWIGQSGHNRVTHNDISDYFYTGISVGWTWGYGASLATHNTIDFNHIHHLGWGVLSDMGAVYTLGISPGTTVSNNTVHDVYSYDLYGRGGWGLYNDEGSTGIVLENNLVHHVKTGSYHQHYGEANVIRNNIMAFSMDGQVQRSRVEPHLSFTFQRNIVLWDRGAPLAGSWGDPNVKLDHNLYWMTSGTPTFGGMPLAEWQATGKDEGSQIANPRLRNDWTVPAGSPALKLGFQPFDPGRAGLYGTAAWRRRASSLNYPRVRFAPAPPRLPITVSEGFEDVVVGAPCPDAQNNTEGKAEAIQVTDEVAYSGTRSLRIREVAGLQNGYDPHLVFTPYYQAGKATCSFAMRYSGDENLSYEWRDWHAGEYRTGPRLTLANGRLVAGDSTLIALLPPNTWCEVRIEASVGPTSDGSWTVIATPKGGTPLTYMAPPDPARKLVELSWIGWCSNGIADATLWLDDISISRQGVANR